MLVDDRQARGRRAGADALLFRPTSIRGGRHIRRQAWILGRDDEYRAMTEGQNAGMTGSRPPFADPDGFYQALVEAHEGLDVEQCLLLNARLILLLAQQLGNEELAYALLREAARGVGTGEGGQRLLS
jgi:hypothetical protein